MATLMAGILALRTLTFRDAAPSPKGFTYGELLTGNHQAMEACIGTSPPGFSETGDRSVGSIAPTVEAIRDLRFGERPNPLFLSRKEIERRLSRIRGARYRREDLDREARILVALGVGGSRSEIRTTLLEAGVPLGVYLPGSGPIVRDSGAGFTLQEEITAAHELAHALVDDAVGLPDRRSSSNLEDRELALSALAEGDATLVEGRYRSWRVSGLERFVLSAVEGTFDRPDVPDFLIRASSFPYRQGFAFVCELYERGGWNGVDLAYDRPPRSSAEILFPGRYLRGETPEPPPRPAGPGPGWKLTAARPFGAAHLWWLFEAPGGLVERALDDPLGRAAGWGGGRVWLWTRGPNSALLVSLVQHPSGLPLCGSLLSWHEAAFPEALGLAKNRSDEWLGVTGPDGSAVLVCSGDSVRLGLAPDIATARRLTDLRSPK